MHHDTYLNVFFVLPYQMFLVVALKIINGYS